MGVIETIRGLVTRVFTDNLEDGQITRVMVDPGGNPARTTDHISSPGLDAPPLEGDDFGFGLRSSGEGRFVVLGYASPRSWRSALPGERRQVSRAISGDVVAEFYLRRDGTILLLGAGGGKAELQTNGDWDVNGAKITIDGDVVTSDGISLRSHTHEGSPTAPDGDVSDTGGPK